MGGKHTRRKKRKEQKLAFIFLCESLILAVILIIGFGKLKKEEKHTDKDKIVYSTEKEEKKKSSNVDKKTQNNSTVFQDKQDVIANTEESFNQDELVSEDTPSSVRQIIQNMTLEEKVAQLFVITPEALTGVGTVTDAGEITKKAIEEHPIGGLVYFEKNITSEEQFVEMVRNAQSYSMDRMGLPLLICVDEEGGNVVRISGQGIEGVPEIAAMSVIGETGDSDQAYYVNRQIGEYLSRFHVNVDFAPVADVYTNDSNTVIRTRAFGSDPALVADMVTKAVSGLKSQNIAAALKHFPGHGNTSEDSHSGFAVSNKTLEELRNCELIPFQAGIEAGAELVLVGHISLPNVVGDNTPASLSYTVITDLLRKEMGFDGIVITDAMNMGAITNKYKASEAAVSAIQAGVDIVLMPADFAGAYNGVLEAVRQGIIDESRIDQSLERILKLKNREQ